MSNTLINQAMKRLLTLGLMLASAFALTNCAEQLDTPDQEKDIIVDVTDHEYGAGDPYEIYVDDVDTKTNYTSAGKTVWSNGDKILVYSKPAGSADGYIGHGQYEYCTLNDGRKGFKGYLGGTLSNKNDSYFIYTDSSSASTSPEGVISIGGSSLSQDPGENPLKYVMENCPLWGQDNRVDKKERPRFKMKYLYSVVALKIVNNAEGAIVLDNVEIRTDEEIAGDFNVVISDGVLKYTPVSGKAAKTSKVLLNNKIELTNPGDEYTIYLPVKPFTAKKKSKISVLVNSSIRTITLDRDIEFKVGEKTTLNIPVNVLVNETATDGKSFLEFVSNCTYLPTSKINGRTVADMFVIGTSTSSGSVKIKGKLTDVLDALPLGFFVSSWNGGQGVLVIEEIKAGISIAGKNVGTTLKKADLARMMNKTEDFFVISPYSTGAYTEDTSKSQNIIILDEEPLQKAVDEAKANTFLTSYNITVAEIKEAIKGKNDKGQQDKLYQLLYDNSAQIRELKATKLIGWMIGPSTLCGAMQLAECSVVLKSANKGEFGATDPRVVMWGLDIKGSN